MSHIEAQAYKLKSGKKRNSSKAKPSNAIDLCITLSKNPLTEGVEKDIYIQIVSPNNNVFSNKGEIRFSHNPLIFIKIKTKH